MRTLPAAITSALAASGAQPSVSLASNDLMPRMSSFATIGTAGRNHATKTAAGTILRAVVSQGTDPNTLTVFRITSANIGTAASWAAAGTLLASDARAAAGCCVVQAATPIRIFYYNTSNNICYFQSSDDGATWAGPTVAKAADPSLLICSGIAATSTVDFHAAFYAFTNAGTAIMRSFISAGAWTAWANTGPPSPPSWGQIRGIAVDPTATSQTTDPLAPQADANAGGGSEPGMAGLSEIPPAAAFSSWRIFIAGVDLRQLKGGIASGSFTWDGTGQASSDYSGFTQVLPMDTPDNGTGYQNPSIHYNPADGYYYAGILFTDSGSVTTQAHTRLHIFRTATGTQWHHYTTLGNVFSYECHVLFAAGVMYVFDAHSVYRYTGPPGALDLSSDLLELSIHEQYDHPTQFSLRIANNAGQYNAVPQLVDNAQIQISLGYNGTTITTHTCYIDAITFVDSPTSQELIVTGRDITKFLDQICLTLITKTSATVSDIATAICQAAEVNLKSLPGTSQFLMVVPSFSIVPGETWLHALTRLSQIYNFQIMVQYPDTLRLLERSAADASTWTYGTERLGLARQISADQPNIVRVVGASSGATNVFGEAIDTANIHASGARRYRHIVDRMCDTSAKCILKAQLALRDDQTKSTLASLTVRLNPAHELADPITISSTNIGMPSTKMRINRIDTLVNFQSGQHEQHLSLELP